MAHIVREMTLQEEIETLPIDETIKQRLLSKLKECNCLLEEREALLAKQREEMYSSIVPLKEANIALLTACEGLSKAMVAQGKLNKKVL